jgi:hypothetical protein
VDSCGCVSHAAGASDAFCQGVSSRWLAAWAIIGPSGGVTDRFGASDAFCQGVSCFHPNEDTHVQARDKQEPPQRRAYP